MSARPRRTGSRAFPLLALALLSIASASGCRHAPHARGGEGDGNDVEALDAGTSRERFERLERTLAAHVERGELAGVASLVARHGEVVHYAATGLRDRERGVPLTRDTIFRIYSMTKPITSVAVMMLVERGQLLLGDPVSKHLPELAGMKVLRTPDSPLSDVVAAPREMTIRDLLTHTSGLASASPGFVSPAIEQAYLESDLRGSQTELPPAEWIARLARIPLAHPPGTKFLYGVSTDVLGHLVAVVSGRPFEDFLQSEIFAPLGMSDTAFFVPDEKLDRFAATYGPGQDGRLALVDAPSTSRYREPPAFPSGAGGLVSTIDDYLRFCEMLRRGASWTASACSPANRSS